MFFSVLLGAFALGQASPSMEALAKGKILRKFLKKKILEKILRIKFLLDKKDKELLIKFSQQLIDKQQLIQVFKLEKD